MTAKGTKHTTAKVERTAGGDTLEHPIDVNRSRCTRSNTRDKSTLLLQIIGHIHRVEHDVRVEEGKEDHHEGVNHIVIHVPGAVAA